MSVIVVDDEPLACDELAFLLREFPDVEVAATGHNGLEATQLIEEWEPDVAFLDVQMPGLDGLGVIRALREREGPLPHFVLATAYDHYALEAFRVEALDYLLKPVDRERLAETVQRAQRVVGEKQRAALENLNGHPPRNGPPLSKLLVKSGNRNFIVDAQDMVYATIDDGLITVVASNVEGQSNFRTIEELQSSLDSDLFWRVHRSYLININRIREVVPWFKSSFQLKMDDKRQTEIPVSRVQTKRLRTLFRL